MRGILGTVIVREIQPGGVGAGMLKRKGGVGVFYSMISDELSCCFETFFVVFQ